MAQQETSILLPLIKAAIVHLLMFGLLFISFHPTLKQQPQDLQVKTSPIIKAKAISSETVKKLVEKKQKRINDAARAEQDRKRKIRQAADRKKKAALNKKRNKALAEKKRKKALADKKRKVDAEEKRKADAEKKRKADAEKKRKADAEQKRKLEQEFQAQLNAEANAAHQRQVLSEAQKYLALVKRKISRNWITPNQSGICILKIRLGAGGYVIDVQEVSGLDAICRTAKAAVYKADPLPASKDLEVFNKMRIFELELDPQEKH